MQLARSFWLAVNTRMIYHTYEGYERIGEDGNVVRVPGTERLRKTLQEVAEKVKQWRQFAQGEETKEERDESAKELFLTSQTCDDILLTCAAIPGLIDDIFDGPKLKGVRPQFIPKLLTQDFLERDFADLRQRCGGALMPPMQSAVYVLRTMNANRLNKFRTNQSAISDQKIPATLPVVDEDKNLRK